jgi:hypothetical protein
MERIGKIIVIPADMMLSSQRSCQSAQTKGKASGNKPFRLDTELVSHSVHVDLVDLALPPSLQARLFPHQKIGVSWLYGVFLANTGGILGDGNQVVSILLIVSFSTD